MKKIIPFLFLTSITALCSSCVVIIRPTSSTTPTGSEISIADSAKKIARAAKVYGGDGDDEKLLSSCGSELSSSEDPTTYGDMFLMLNTAFSSYLPEHIGARVFEGNPTSLSMYSISGIAKNSQKYAALTSLSNIGLFTTDDGRRSLNAASYISESSLKTYLDRYHAYFGTSQKDDFFSTVNHDFLYDECEDDGKTATDSVYRSDLISEDNSVSWVKSLGLGEVDDFVSTYMDMDRRVSGDACGVVEALTPLLNAASVSEFVNALKTMVKENGYCPLWSSIKYGNQTLSLTSGTTYKKAVVASCFDNTESPSEFRQGSTGYRESIERFTPIFQEVLGVTQAKARIYATNYTTFKYYFATGVHTTYVLSRSKLWSPVKGVTYGDGFNLYDFLSDCGVSDPSSFYWQDGAFIQSLLACFSEEKLDYLKGWAIWQMLEHYLICLPDKDATMAWAHTSGARHDEEELSSTSFYSSYVLPAVGNTVYSYYIGTEEYKEDVEIVFNLIENIKTTFAERVAKASWVSSSTPGLVRAKLEKMDYIIGGNISGTSMMEYPGADFLSKEEGGSLYLNLGRDQKAKFEAGIKGLGTSWSTSNRKENFLATAYEYTPLYSNAFYVPWTNGIDITMGYMSAYKRPSLMSSEELLATYGWVVGHEISHGFDASGIYYNAQGNYVSTGYLSQNDFRTFRNRSSNVTTMYTGVEVMPGMATSGSIVLDEAIADITGLTIANEIGAKISGFDYSKFYTLAAKSFASYASQATYDSSLATDTHPFGRARVNTAFQSQDNFYTTFGIEEEDGMYLAPSDRAYVW